VSFEHKDNSGSLFRNERKEQPNHPDHTGTAKIGGQEYYVSGWVKEKNGKRFFSLAFKPKQARSSGSPSSGGRW